jgi:RNA polymerase sigma-B factor
MIGPSSQPVPTPPAPVGWTRQGLAALDDRELLSLAGSLPRSGQRGMAACEQLVVRYRFLVRSCVQRYNRGHEPAEDLLQVGYAGLVAAINNFDPAVGCSLATYARWHINGEIKRYFRDNRWQVHIVRPVKELMLQIRTATWQLAQELGRMPTESDLAASLGVSGPDLRNAMLAELAAEPSSLDAPLSGQPGTALLADLLGEEDRRLDHLLDMQAVATHWRELPPDEQKILFMCFYGGMTQDKIGQRLGLSQMQVSRLLGRALGYLRSRLLGLDEGDRSRRRPVGGKKS